MMPSKTESRLVMRLLDERSYRIAPACPVVCRLWRMIPESPPAPSTAPVYAIGMESMTERYLYCVGSHEESVRALFTRVTEGKLHPIHLGDVTADYLWERERLAKQAGEISQSPLQTEENMV